MSPGDTLDGDKGRNKNNWCHLIVCTVLHSVCVLCKVKVIEKLWI